MSSSFYPYKKHALAAKHFNKDAKYVDWHDSTLWWIRQKRDIAAQLLNEEWEHLRNSAAHIKEHTLSNLAHYLTEFETHAKQNGIQVHWAKDAEEHNQIIYTILKQKNVTQIVKSKSMLTEECELNNFLLYKGIEVIDTDLGERIVQLEKAPPSHIVLPCIHKKKEEIGEIFHQHLNTPKGNADPIFLTHAARHHLRSYFEKQEVAITGVNFAVAETGEFVICTNEGNADMGAHLADIHIACMGIEKIIPQRKDLGVFLRLLARSATGQAITTYSSHFKKPTLNKTIHIVLLDNGRSEILGKKDFYSSLKCIRCGACMNTCPIYRKSGGYSYHTVVAGPIGSILAPHHSLKKFSDLPFASTLCGSCSNVCPVKINIHEQLYLWRQEIGKSKYVSKRKKIAMYITGKIFASTFLFNTLAKIGRFFLSKMPFLFHTPFNPWTKVKRNMPKPTAPYSFNEWYKKYKQ